MLRIFLIIGIFILAAPMKGWAQNAVSATAEQRSASFRPSPLRGDQSQLPGRTLSLRDQMAENRVILLSPPGGGTLPPIDLERRRAESRARLRAQQSARAQIAAQTLRQAAAAPRTRRQVNHVLTYTVEDVQPSRRFLEVEAGERSRRIAGLANRLGVRDLAVDVVGRTAVITGTAVDDSRLRVLERVVLLEPGVDEVDNRIVVEGSEIRD